MRRQGTDRKRCGTPSRSRRRHDSTRDQRHPMGQSTTRDPHRHMAPRAGRHRGRPRAARSAPKRSSARCSCSSRPVSHRTSRLRAPRSVRLPLTACPQRFMAKRAGATITRVHFSHASPVSHRPSRDPAHPARRSPSSLTTPTPARRHGVSQQFTLDPSSPLASAARARHRTGPRHVINAPDQDHLPERASE
jgi:hypothetical protein